MYIRCVNCKFGEVYIYEDYSRNKLERGHEGFSDGSSKGPDFSGINLLKTRGFPASLAVTPRREINL